MKLGIVGQAMKEKIVQQNRRLTKEEQEHLATLGYTSRGTGFVKDNKFVSNKEIDEKIEEYRGAQASPVRESVKSGDKVFDLVKSISVSTETLADLILDRETPIGPDATPMSESPNAKEEKAGKSASIFDIPIMKKLKGLFGLGMVFLLQMAYPVYLEMKEIFQKTQKWVSELYTEYKEKVFTFFTVSIPRFVEDIKDFFTVKVPSHFNDFVESASISIQNLLDVPKKVMLAMEGFATTFASNVVNTINPWLKKVGVNLDSAAADLKKRQDQVKEKEKKLDQQQKDREEGLKQAKEARSGARTAYDETKEARRKEEDAARAAPTPTPPSQPAVPAAPLPAGGIPGLIQAALQENGITSSKAIANILATVKAESNFKPRSEALTYTSAERIAQVFGKRRIPSVDFARQFVNNPELLANYVYARTDGNSEPGDGYKYRGRGFIQHTGKNQYKAIKDFTGIDVVNNPDELNKPEVAAKAIPWFFLKYKKKTAAELDSMAAVNKSIGFAGGAAEGAHREQLAESMYASMQGNQVASATQAADIRPPKQTGVVVQTAQASQGKEKGGRTSPPNSAVITAGYKEHFAVT